MKTSFSKEVDLYKLTNDSLKWPQIDAAFRRLYDIDNKECFVGGFDYKSKDSTRYISAILEFGTGAGNSTKKICDYLTENGMNDVYVFTFDRFCGLPEETKGIEIFSKYTKGAYSLDLENPVGYIYDKVSYENLVVTKCNFDCIDHYIDTSLIGRILLVHIDCDLYISTKQALTWLFNNKLIQPGTLLAFDEFVSTKHDWLGGESKAWYEAVDKHNCITEEIFHNTYKDNPTGQKIRQSLFEVLSV